MIRKVFFARLTLSLVIIFSEQALAQKIDSAVIYDLYGDSIQTIVGDSLYIDSMENYIYNIRPHQILDSLSQAINFNSLGFDTSAIQFKWISSIDSLYSLKKEKRSMIVCGFVPQLIAFILIKDTARILTIRSVDFSLWDKKNNSLGYLRTTYVATATKDIFERNAALVIFDNFYLEDWNNNFIHLGKSVKVIQLK